VTLTRAGKELHANVSKLLAYWNEIFSKLQDENQSVKGRVSIGCHSTLAPFMSSMVADLFAQHPNLEIHFQHEFRDKIVEWVVKGDVEIGIVTDPYPHPELVLQTISNTEFTFWISINHSKIDLYAEDTIIICDPRLSPTQYLLNELSKKINHSCPRLSTMNQMESMAAMTAEGYGVSILPSRFTERYFGDKLKRIPDAPLYNKPLCLVYRPENKTVMAVQVVLNAIRALAKE
jgi:DNA-binding transcriptional LysR family regulator